MKQSKPFLVNWFLLNLIFLGIHLGITGQVHMPFNYFKLLLLMNGTWLIIVLIEHKFSLQHLHSFLDIVLKLGRINLLILAAISFTLVLLGLHGFKRLYIFGTFSLLFVVEVIATGIFYPQLHSKISENAGFARTLHRLSVSLIFADLQLYLVFFFWVHYFKYQSITPSERAGQILGIMLGLWWLSAHWTGKFEKRHQPNFFYAYEPFVKAAILMVSTATLLIFSLGLFHYSRSLLLTPVLLLLLAESLLVLIWVRVRSVEEEPDIEDLEKVNQFLDEEKLEVTPAKNFQESARAQLHQHYLVGHDSLYNWIDGHLNLDAIEVSQLCVLDTHTPYNIQVLGNQSLQMFINLHCINDFHRINHYFLSVHAKLVQGGYFIGIKETNESRKASMQKKYPQYMFEFFYTMDFMYHRILAKLPVMKKIYYALSGGRGRAISCAELLGRLYFCGFRVLAVSQTGGILRYVAQKDKPPRVKEVPSTGLLVRLKRIGYQGQFIYLYKLRTMHPYSEFIQHYAYRRNTLNENGKIKDDFRVTGWGKVLRRYWLDELPQLMNYLRGDVKIVGVRPLSEHYFSLYPRDLQKMRVRFKPGLIPPYYVDLPTSQEQIYKSERLYFEQKRAHPLRTDWQYFFKAIYNIVVKKARSQ